MTGQLGGYDRLSEFQTSRHQGQSLVCENTVVRKLAMLWHRLWLTRESYDWQRT